MYFKNLLLSISLLFCQAYFFSFDLFSQTSPKAYNQEYMNSYYQQKVTLFELLPKSTDDIIFLGNSITDIGEWAELWQNINVKNRGISSDITKGVLARLEDIVEGKPAKLFIMIGINDIARNIPDTVIFNNYVDILNKVIAANPSSKVYVQSILPTNNAFTEYKNHQNKQDKINSINSSLVELCNQLNVNVFYIDLNPHFANDEGKLKKEYTNDGLHLNGAGYLKWKEILEEKGLCCD